MELEVPVMGAEDHPAAGRSTSRAADPPTDGEPEAQVEQAVDAGPRKPEERATAEIHALEEDLDRERERAAKSLDEVQRRLEAAEAHAAGNVTITDVRAREEAADWLREQRGDVRRELEAELERRMLARERELIAERDEAAAALKDALARLEQAESESGDSEGAREEAQRQVREDADRRLREHTKQLQAQIESMEKETEARIQDAVE